MHNYSIHHYGIVVENIEQHYKEYFEIFFDRTHLSATYEDPLQKARVAFIDAAGGRIELVEPMSEDSPVYAFAKKNKAGYHHICLNTDNIEKSIEELCQKSFMLVSEPKPAIAFANKRVAFLISRNKLLWELLEN